jgi:hypothetical protein
MRFSLEHYQPMKELVSGKNYITVFYLRMFHKKRSSLKTNIPNILAPGHWIFKILVPIPPTWACIVGGNTQNCS